MKRLILALAVLGVSPLAVSAQTCGQSQQLQVPLQAPVYQQGFAAPVLQAPVQFAPAPVVQTFAAPVFVPQTSFGFGFGGFRSGFGFGFNTFGGGVGFAPRRQVIRQTTIIRR